ncbi:MAG: DMT family transporter [Clostridia bacterium]|nr:DMT family transporter [Clostridia bacterium]
MKKYISPILFIIATMLWGFAFAAQKAASDLPAFTLGALRSIIAVLFLMAVIPLLDKFTKNGRRILTDRKRPDIKRAEIIGGIVAGIILATASAFQQTGLGEGTDAGKAAFITALYVVIVPVISLFFGKRPPVNVYISVVIAVIGFYFLCIKPGTTLIFSDLLVLICALIFALHIIAIDRLSPGCDGVRMSLVQFATAFVVNAVLALIFELPINTSLILDRFPAILYLAIGSSGIAYTLQIVGQKDCDPTVASILLSLESVFGVIGGALFLGETMTKREYFGCVIVFLAVVLSQLDFKAIFAKMSKDVNNT